jgi:hypothetical protein
MVFELFVAVSLLMAMTKVLAIEWKSLKKLFPGTRRRSGRPPLNTKHARSRRGLRRRHWPKILKGDAAAWDPADHPDIEQAGGTAAWVRKLRREADKASRRRIRLKSGS